MATAIDGTYKASVDTDTLETKDIIIKVDKKRSNKEYAYVEWSNKRAKDIEKQIEEKIRQAEEAPATKDGAIKMKKAFIEQMKKNKEKIIKTTIARRIEKINTRTGQVEETEFYNNRNEKIGWTKVKKFSIFKYQFSIKDKRDGIQKNKEKI